MLSHCGTGIVSEALYFGKPVVCLPFIGDQVRVGACRIGSQSGHDTTPHRLCVLDPLTLTTRWCMLLLVVTAHAAAGCCYARDGAGSWHHTYPEQEVRLSCEQLWRALVFVS